MYSLLKISSLDLSAQGNIQHLCQHLHNWQNGNMFAKLTKTWNSRRKPKWNNHEYYVLIGNKPGSKQNTVLITFVDSLLVKSLDRAS